MAGKRVLHVGYEPKHDSTAALLRGRSIEPVVDRIEKIDGVTADDSVVRSRPSRTPRTSDGRRPLRRMAVERPLGAR